MDDDVKRMQTLRAQEVARLLSGGRVTRGIERAMLALVESVERPGEHVTPTSAGPVAGARQVLKPKVKPAQEGLW